MTNSSDRLATARPSRSEPASWRTSRPARSQHDALAALLRDDPLVVRKVEGGRLHAPVRVAGGEDLVDDHDRSRAAEPGIAVFGVDRQVILDILQLAGEALQLARLGL